MANPSVSVNIGGGGGGGGSLVGGIAKLTGIAGLMLEAIKSVDYIIKPVMAILRAVLALLFLPLVPILVPILKIVGKFLPALAEISKSLSNFIDKVISPILEITGEAMIPIVDWVAENFSDAMEHTTNMWIDIMNNFSEGTLTFLNWLGTAVVTFFKDLFSGLKKVALDLWNKLMLGFDLFKTIGLRLWEIIKSPFEWFRDKLNSIISTISGFFGFGKKKAVGGYISQEGAYYLHRGERVVSATEKNPSSGAGNMVLNFNFNNPQIRGEQDARELVRIIERTLQTKLRGYTSYGTQ